MTCANLTRGSKTGSSIDLSVVCVFPCPLTRSHGRGPRIAMSPARGDPMPRERERRQTRKHLRCCMARSESTAVDLSSLGCRSAPKPRHGQTDISGTAISRSRATAPGGPVASPIEAVSQASANRRKRKGCLGGRSTNKAVQCPCCAEISNATGLHLETNPQTLQMSKSRLKTEGVPLLS